jgi:hypothetical protein
MSELSELDWKDYMKEERMSKKTEFVRDVISLSLSKEVYGKDYAQCLLTALIVCPWAPEDSRSAYREMLDLLQSMVTKSSDS